MSKVARSFLWAVLLVALTARGTAADFYEAVIIEKDSNGALSIAEETQLNDALLKIRESFVRVWVEARVDYDPALDPDSEEGLSQQRRIDRAVGSILRRLERRDLVDVRLAERPNVGPHVNVPLQRAGIEALVQDRRVNAFYVIIPRSGHGY